MLRIVHLIQKGVDSISSILKNMGVFNLDRFSGLIREFFHWFEGGSDLSLCYTFWQVWHIIYPIRTKHVIPNYSA